MTTQAVSNEVIWHDVECGGYEADLDLWLALAKGHTTVLDVGCGTGRVTLALIEQGHAVTGLDTSAALLTELRRRARAREKSVRGTHADARDFNLGRRFDLILAPMQLVQLLGGRTERLAFLRCAARHLREDGLLAIALMDVSGEPVGADYRPPLPDMREQDGWVYSSQPTEIRLMDRGRTIALDRLRTTVSPTGETGTERDSVKLRLVSPDRLEQEAAGAGLAPVGRRTIAPTEDHVGSVVVLLRLHTG